MPRRAPPFAFAFATFAASAAVAQEGEGFGGSADTEAELAAQADAPETYTVQPGDTLWDLSKRFLNNPWYWPRIWSYNPQLDNPNWIQPGSMIRFYPGPDQAPVEVTPPAASEASSELELDIDLGDIGEFEDIPLFELAPDLIKSFDRIPAANTQRLRRELFLPDEVIDAAGTLEHAPEEKVLLSEFDRVYLRTEQQPTPGETLAVFRVGREVVHPVTGTRLGRLVQVRGLLRIDSVSEQEHLGTLLTSWGDVRRGDRVGDLGSLEIESVGERPNDREVKGYVVESARESLSYLGENHIVFLDRGRNDGVAPGNTFVVVRTGDPYTGDLRGMADEDIGRILVVDVSSDAATGLVVFSNREILVGDRIEMRTEP